MTDPSPTVSPALSPVTQTERIASIDVLRGVVVLGILVWNIQLFAMHEAAWSNPYGCAFTDRPNVLTWVLLQIFVGYKDITIFSMLFGAGILMMDARCAATGRNATSTHYRRMVVLIIFGLLHAYLIWPGDILYHYAMCGLIVYVFRNLRPGLLIALGFAAYLVPLVLVYPIDWFLQRTSSAEAIYALFSPTAEQIAAHNETYRAGWLAQMPDRAAMAIGVQTIMFPFLTLWICGGMMLVGAGFHRLGVFTARLATKWYLLMIAGGLVVGMPLVLYGLYRGFEMDWSPEYVALRGRLLPWLAAPLTGWAYVAAIILVCRSGRIRWLTDRLAAAGQMALTNYLMQSVICSLIFYGHGLGMVGRIDRIGQVGIIAVVWILQLIASPLWLKRFRFGPVEWLWRVLSYGRLQPMRRPREVANPESGRAALSANPAQPGNAPAVQARVSVPGAGSLSSTDKRPLRTIWKILAFAGMTLAGLGLAAVLSTLVSFVVEPEAAMAVLYTIAAPVVLLSSWACLRLFDNRPLAAVGVGFDRPWALHGIGGGLLGAVLLGLCVVLFRISGWSETTGLPGGVIPWAGLLIGAVHTLGLAIHEEVQCRGYAFQLLARWNPAVAVVLAGLFFVAMHLPNPGGMTWSAMLNMFLLHLLLTACYWRTRSLWLPIGVHFGWNYMLGYVLGLPVSGAVYSATAFSTETSLNIWTGNAFGPEGGLIATATLALATILVWTLLPQRHPTPDLLAD